MDEEEIIRQYAYLVRSKARGFFLAGADQEDVIQEGMIGLLRAVRDYRPERDVSFVTFADLCIRRQIMKAVQAAGREKRRSLNESLSLDAEEAKSFWLAETQKAPEDGLIEQEAWEDWRKKLDILLSKKEKKVLEWYLEGLSYEEIGQKLQISRKAVDNAIQRIRQKVK